MLPAFPCACRALLCSGFFYSSAVDGPNRAGGWAWRQVVKKTSMSFDQIMICFLCTGLGLLMLKATGMWDNMVDNFYQLVSPLPPAPRPRSFQPCLIHSRGYCVRCANVGARYAHRWGPEGQVDPKVLHGMQGNTSVWMDISILGTIPPPALVPPLPRILDARH